MGRCLIQGRAYERARRVNGGVAGTSKNSREMRSHKMKIIIRLTGIITAVLVVSLLVSCAPRFQKVGPVPEGKALVYIYRPMKFFHGGLDYVIYANGFKAGVLYNGGYIPFRTKPGRIQFSARTEVTSYVTLDVERGGSYYIRCVVHRGILKGRPHLTLVEKSVGEREIRKCKLKKQRQETGL